MPNELRADFIFDNSAGFRAIDATEQRLSNLNNNLNNLGADFGKSLADNFSKASNTIQTQSSSLTASLTNDFKSLENAGANSLNRINDFANATKSVDTSFTSNLSSNLNSVGTDFNRLEKQTTSLKTGFDAIAKQRLDGGQVNDLTREVVKASERSRQLQNDIVGIRRELSSPNRKSSVAFLTDELRAAEKEAESLSRKLSTVQSVGSVGGSATTRRRGLSETQRAVLEIADDFVPAGFNKPFNAVSKEFLAISTLSASTLVTLGSVAAVGFGIVKLSQSIREESERRLKAENAISAAVNKQILGQIELNKQFEEQRKNAERSRNFAISGNTNGISDTVEQLRNRRANLERVRDLLPKTDTDNPLLNKFKNDVTNLNTEILSLDAQIFAKQQQNTKAANDAFSQRNESFKKSQESAVKFGNILNAEIDKEKLKFAELGKAYQNSLENLAFADNPLAKQFFEIETATERAQKKFGQFGASVVNQIASIEKANLNKAIGIEKFQNSFDALKLRQDAFKLQNTPERQFADSQRNLETVSRTADFISTDIQSERALNLAEFYAKQFNPNNPKSFNDQRFSVGEKSQLASVAGNRNRGESLADFGARQRQAIESGIRQIDAISDISKLKQLSLDGTGAAGKGIVSEKILSAIPSREELLKSLASPLANIRGNAQSLLNEQATALFAKREADTQKFNEFLDDQRLSQFAKGFAKDQIGLINRDLGLTDDEKAKRRLSVTDALGNDLDADLRRGRINDFIQTANAKDKLAADAMKIASDTKDAVEALLKLLKDQGIKIDNDGKEPQGVTVTVIDNTTGGGVEAGLVPAPNTNNQTVNSTFFQDAGF